MRLQLTEDGNIRATMQPRPDGSQSRPFCCDAGHETVAEAGQHGLELELADELALWLAAPQPVIVTEAEALEPVPGQPDTFKRVIRPVDPHVAEGERPVYAFDRRLLAAKGYPHMTRSRDGKTVRLLGLTYRVVHEGPASVVGVRVPG